MLIGRVHVHVLNDPPTRAGLRFEGEGGEGGGGIERFALQ